MKRSKLIQTMTSALLAAVFFACGFLCCRIAFRHGEDTQTTEKKLAEAVQILRDYYVGEINESEMTDAAIAAMVASLNDRWSYYLPASELESYRNTQNNQYGGLGLILSEDEAGVAYILKVFPKSPAGEAGVPQGSRFLRAGEQNIEGLGLDETQQKIRELIEGGLAELTVQSPEGETLTFSLIPGEVLTDPVSASVLDSGFGYVRIENFEARSGTEAIEAFQNLLEQQVPGIIFDVRENPGGQLTELLQLLDYLLPEGEIFHSVDAEGNEYTEMSDAECRQIPMVVLVNEDSYSAAEFFAAVLDDYDWAKVVGAQTSGKGAAQVTILLEDQSAIHISNIYYFTPSGKSLVNVGLTPDICVDMDAEARMNLYYDLLDKADDVQLQAAETTLRELVG